MDAHSATESETEEEEDFGDGGHSENGDETSSSVVPEEEEHVREGDDDDMEDPGAREAMERALRKIDTGGMMLVTGRTSLVDDGDRTTLISL